MNFARYGREESYGFLEKKRIGAFVKHTMFRREKEKAFRDRVYRKENMPYDDRLDRCPAGRYLTFHHVKTVESENGHLLRSQRPLDVESVRGQI
jgi:hypothetical protein